jgi:hypothetical protein
MVQQKRVPKLRRGATSEPRQPRYLQFGTAAKQARVSVTTLRRALTTPIDRFEDERATVFQILTKRPVRMRKFLAARYGNVGIPWHLWFRMSVEDNRVAARLNLVRRLKDQVGDFCANGRIVHFRPVRADAELRAEEIAADESGVVAPDGALRRSNSFAAFATALIFGAAGWTFWFATSVTTI